MEYYFECETCNSKEYFNYENQTKYPYLNPPKYHDLNTPKAKKQSNETVICDSCISKKVRLKGNHIIINRSNNNG